MRCHRTPKGRLGYSIFGVVQEALQNVIRHAEVLEAWVTVRVEGEWIVVEVRDEGVGFQPLPPTEASVDGIGLLTMRERTQLEGERSTCERTPEGAPAWWLGSP